MAFVIFERDYIFLKKTLKLLISEHFIDEFEYGLFVIIIELAIDYSTGQYTYDNSDNLIIDPHSIQH
ncbi:MAG: hypothetical protein U0T36_10930 [Saprospiraceae bacterium]